MTRGAPKGAAGALLSVDELTVRVSRRTVVDRVSFDVAAGEVVSVIGPNGAGKTTLLEAIVGLRPATGLVRVADHALRSFRDRARSCAFGPDNASPPSETTVRTLLDHAHAHRPRDERILGSLRVGLGLEPLIARSSGALSRGERNRVALYLALAAARPVVVLDEPFGAFDPLQLRDVLASVRAVAETGAAILVSIHQLTSAERLADRVLLLSAGRRLAFGTLSEIHAQAGSSGSLEEAFVALLERKGERRAS